MGLNNTEKKCTTRRGSSRESSRAPAVSPWRAPAGNLDPRSKRADGDSERFAINRRNKIREIFSERQPSAAEGNGFCLSEQPPPVSGDSESTDLLSGASALPGATATIGWQVFTAPVCWETPHIHKYDEFLIFLGAELPDLCSSYDAEIDLWMGEEMEKHTITSTTVVFIPKGVQHAPLNFRAIRKPVLFHALYLGPSLDRSRESRDLIWQLLTGEDLST